MEIRIVREEANEPVPSHGGPARQVTWKLMLNGQEIAQHSSRFRWDYDGMDRCLDPVELSELMLKIGAAMTTSPDARPLVSDEAVREVWNNATNAVCQEMQERGMCNCPDGDCLAAKVEPSPADLTAALPHMRPAAEPVGETLPEGFFKKQAEEAANACGVTPYSDMRVFVEVAVDYALRKHHAARIRSALVASPAQQEPVTFVSAEQLAALPPDPTDEGGAGYLPLRHTPKGKFQMGLYASPAPAVTEAVDGDHRLWWFLHILDACGGTASASDERGEWVAAFCSEVEQRDPDTYNISEAAGYTRTSHDSWCDTSKVSLTDKGRAAIRARSEEATDAR